MPTVPRLDRPQVATAPLPTPQTTPMAEGGAVASVGLDVAGRVVGGLARVVERENVRMDEIRASEAELAYRRQLDDVLLNPEKGLLRQRGKRAVEVGTEAQSTFQRILSEAESGLATERQRAMFRARADAMNVTAERQVMAHIGAEMTAVDRQSHEALMIADRESIAALAQSGDMPAVDATIKRMADRLVLFGNRNGWDENALERAEQVEISGARTIQLGAMIDGTMGDPDRLARVRETFRTVSDTLTTQDRETVQKGLAVAELSAQANAIANRLLSGTDDEVERNSVIAGIENPVLRDAVRKRVNAEEDAAERAVKQRRERLFNDAQGLVIDGRDVPPMLRAQLTTEQNNTLDRYQQAPVNDNAAWLTVYQMDPKTLAGLSDSEFRSHWSKLNISHRSTFERMRSDAQQAGGGADGGIGTTRILSNQQMVERAARLANGIPEFVALGQLKGKAQAGVSAFIDKAQARIWDEEARTGKSPTPERIQEIVDELATTVYREDRVGVSRGAQVGLAIAAASRVPFPFAPIGVRSVETPAYQVEDLGSVSAIAYRSIPSRDVDYLRNQLQGNGVTATEALIEELYTVGRFEGTQARNAKLLEIVARRRLGVRP